MVNRLCKVFLFFWLSLAFAQDYLISTVTEIAAIIETAENEVFISVADLLSEDLAFSLMRAATQRGVNVFVLLDGQKAGLGSSYALYLSQYVELRLTRVTEPILIIDRNYVVTGPLLEGAVAVSKEQETKAFEDTTAARGEVSNFVNDWNQSVPLTLEWDMIWRNP